MSTDDAALLEKVKDARAKYEAMLVAGDSYVMATGDFTLLSPEVQVGLKAWAELLEVGEQELGVRWDGSEYVSIG